MEIVFVVIASIVGLGLIFALGLMIAASILGNDAQESDEEDDL